MNMSSGSTGVNDTNEVRVTSTSRHRRSAREHTRTVSEVAFMHSRLLESALTRETTID